MDNLTWLRRIDLHDRRSIYTILPIPVIAYTGYRILRTLISSQTKDTAKIFASPRQSLQLLSAQRLEDLPYPPNALPGARDVDTPYGNIRVYEWGPEDGRKVFLVHGISTPCIAFASMAKLLVEEGCRVMLFDLFGRGYSDAPDPALYQQDIRLFTSQILLVLSSSKLAWTGPNRFTMIGYSMGGGISAAFTSYFPSLVETLILIAPAGLMRPSHITTSSKLVYGNMLPRSLVNYYVGRRMRRSPTASARSGNPEATSRTGAIEAAESEVLEHPAHAANSLAPIFAGRPRISPAHAVEWQLDAHPGFLAVFISSIQHAPITGEHDRWKLIGSRQAAGKASSDPEKTQMLKEGRVLILLGKQDNVVIADEVEADATEALGVENVSVVKLDGGHDLPIVNAQGCVDAMMGFWDAASK